MSLKIYLAAPWANRDNARGFGERLEAAGFAITEKWWDQEPSDEHDDLAAQASKDVLGVAMADLFIVLQLGQSEGKAVETGMAMAWVKPIIVVNPLGVPAVGSGNIFHHLLHTVRSFEEALDMAAKVQAGYEAIAPTTGPLPQGDGDGR